MSKVKFEDVATRVNTRENKDNTSLLYYVGGDHIESGELVVHNRGLIEGSTIGPMFYFGFKKGDILLVSRNPHLRKAAMVDFDGICSEKTFVLGTKNEKVLLQKYLAVIVQTDSFWNYCEEHKSGGVNFFVNWSTLAKYEFDLPDIEEQRRISDKVWAAYGVKESYRRLIKATDEMVKSRFIEMFGNPLSAEQKYPLKRLTDCVDINPRRPQLSLSDTDQVSFVPMPCVSEEGYLQDVESVDYGTVKKGFTYFEEGDVLFAKITPCMENGKGAIAEDLINGIGMGSTEYHVLREKPGISNKYWILAFTRLPIFREDAAKNMTGTGGQKRVGAPYLSDFRIGLPPIEAQQEFEQLYRQADKSKFIDFKSRFIVQFDRLKKTALSEIAADWDKGQAFKKECIVNEGNTPCIHYGELFKCGPIIDTILSWTNESPIKSSAKGDILFPASDVTPNGLARCSALMIEGVLLGGDIIVLRLKSGFIPEFVSYAINMQKDQLIRRVTGSVVRHISAKSLNSVEIPIPAIPDQKQFISIIRQADKSKFELKQAIEKIDKVMRALLQ